MSGAAVVITGHAQHAAWQAREVPPVEQLTEGLWSLPVPMPARSPLRYVSVYVFAVPGGLVLLDSGWGDDDAWVALNAGLASIGAAVTDVRGVLVTHMHWDHLGLADRIRQASGAWVALHEDDLALITRPEYRDAELAVVRDRERLLRLGASEREADEAGTNPEFWRRFTETAPPDRVLRGGDLADVPGFDLRAIHTPGHTPGHVVFAEARLDTLFAGDHVLPRITPNISVEIGGPDDPLGQYLDSLREVAELPLTHVAPAHEWRFDGLAARAEQIVGHHDRRLAEVIDAVRTHPDTTPWEIASQLTWSRTWDQYAGRMKVFAVTETMAHVARLVATGDLLVTGDVVPHYRVAPSREAR